MILGLGEHHTLRGHDLRGSGIAGTECRLHRLHERIARGAHDHCPWSRRERIEPENFADPDECDDMLLGLGEILGPLVAEILAPRAADGCFVDFDAAALVLERLQQQFMYLCRIMRALVEWTAI